MTITWLRMEPRPIKPPANTLVWDGDPASVDDVVAWWFSVAQRIGLPDMSETHVIDTDGALVITVETTYPGFGPWVATIRPGEAMAMDIYEPSATNESVPFTVALGQGDFEPAPPPPGP